MNDSPTRPALSLEEETELYRSAMIPRFSWLVERFFALTFTRIKPDIEHLPAIRKAASKGIVVYVMRNRSVLDYLFFNWLYVRLNLPLARFSNGVNMLWWSPLFDAGNQIWTKLRDRLRNGPMPDPIDAGFTTRTLRSGNPVLLFLRRPGSWLFRRPQQSRADMIEQLIRLQEESEEPIFIVPQLLLWERRPEYTQRNLVDLLFGERDHPGRLRKILHFLIYHRGAVVRMAEPLDLQAFLEQSTDSRPRAAKKLRLILRGYLYREKRLIKGPTVKPRAWLLDRIRESPQVQEAIQLEAAAERRAVATVERRVDRMLHQLAADFRFNWILFARILFDFVLNRIYAGVEFRDDDAERIRAAGRKGTIVFVPCHRSHLDYILISWCVFYKHLLPPHIAAGANLSFFPLGIVLRRWGAFFLRRSFSSDQLYRTVFSAYIRELVREGYPQEFFIEGTRSRTGALLPPKVGLLSMYLEAAAEGVAQDVMFVPISLSYEKVVEEGEYHKELTGGEKQTEDLRGLASSTQVLRRRYGRVYVRVAPAFSAREMLESAGTPMKEMDGETRKRFLKNVGEHILYKIHRTTPVTPSAVAATVLLSHDRRGMVVREFHRRCAFLIGFLESRDARFSNSLGSEPRDALDEALQVFASNKLVQIFEEEDGDDIIAIVQERRLTMDYYKNNIINHLAEVSMAALAVGPSGRKTEEAIELFQNLRRLLDTEFRMDPDADLDQAWAAAIEELVEVDVLEEEGGRLNILNDARAAFFRANLRSHLESYLITLRGVSVLRRESMTERRLLTVLQKEGRKLYMTEDVTRLEAVTKMTIRNALRHFEETGVLSVKPDRGGELQVNMDARQEQLIQLLDWMGER